MRRGARERGGKGAPRTFFFLVKYVVYVSISSFVDAHAPKMASVTLRFTSGEPNHPRGSRVRPRVVLGIALRAASRSVVPEAEVYENASSSSLELDVSDGSDGSPVSPTAPGVGADAGSHDAASVTGRQQDVQYESLKWNTLPHAKHRLREGVSRSVASAGVFGGVASCPETRSRRGLGGTDVEYEGAVSGSCERGVDETNAGLLWGWVSAEGIAEVSRRFRRSRVWRFAFLFLTFLASSL